MNPMRIHVRHKSPNGFTIGWFRSLDRADVIGTSILLTTGSVLVDQLEPIELKMHANSRSYEWKWVGISASGSAGDTLYLLVVEHDESMAFNY
jgi:hypothetical protein